MNAPDMNRVSNQLPHVICVDLDGTLIRTNILVELFVGLLRSCPWLIFHCPIWLLKGKVCLKRELAKRISLAVGLLPYNEKLIHYLRHQKSLGRQIVLATASDERIARAVADHLGWIDEVIASDGRVNLRGSTKADALVKRFGKAGFAYAGNDRTDLPVWEAAGSAIAVSNSSRLIKQVRGNLEYLISEKRQYFGSSIRAIRIYQWVKNLLVFVPLFVTGQPFNPTLLGTASEVFLCFSLTSSGVYILNDLMDLEADRAHPRKRSRPFANGSMSLVWGLWFGPGLIALGLGMSVTVSPLLAGLLLTYVLLTTAYSLYLKTKPLIDVFSLSLLYTIRILCGAAALTISLSIWLLSFSGLLFLSLAFLKRVAEMSRVQEGSPIPQRMARRGYSHVELEQISSMGIASSFSATIVLALYINSDAARHVYGTPQILWALVPLCLFWLCRLWLSARRGQVDDDPIVYAAKDWVSWLVVVLLATVYISALLGIPST